MPKESATQKKVIHDVMHEKKKGTLKSGKGKHGKVKSRKQAIAIALHEAGASKYESKGKNKKNLQHTLAKKRGKSGGARTKSA